MVKITKIPLSSITDKDLPPLWEAYWDYLKSKKVKSLVEAVHKYCIAQKYSLVRTHRLVSVAATLGSKIRIGPGFTDVDEDPDMLADYQIYMSKKRKANYAYDASGDNGNGNTILVIFSSVELKGCYKAELRWY